MFEKTFCASPWLHMRINPDGAFGPCRWGTHRDQNFNIRTHSVLQYFQEHMAAIRQSMLQGDKLDLCDACYAMEQHGKISGRQRQLLKTGIMADHFLGTLQSSYFLPAFQHSLDHSGCTDLLPVDWQIDLGNHCNSSCVMCSPRYSSRMAIEFQKIGIVENAKIYNRSWTDDLVLVDKFCQDLVSGPSLAYLHFLGGETLLIPAFKVILSKLLDAGMNSTTLGFTTNLTVWPDDVIGLLQKFDHLHVGLSIESLHSINDYVRWPSQHQTVLRNLQRWIELSHQQGYLVQLRLTPSALTILHVADLYQYAYDAKVGVETCNFIHEPRCLSLKVLPEYLRTMAIGKLQEFLADKSLGDQKIVNTRNPHTIRQQSIQDAQSYVNFLQDSEYDIEGAKQLVVYLKKLESSRGNNILHYLPEYENFLRSHDY